MIDRYNRFQWAPRCDVMASLTFDARFDEVSPAASFTAPDSVDFSNLGIRQEWPGTGDRDASAAAGDGHHPEGASCRRLPKADGRRRAHPGGARAKARSVAGVGHQSARARTSTDRPLKGLTPNTMHPRQLNSARLGQ